jgi:hypothetical protein
MVPEPSGSVGQSVIAAVSATILAWTGITFLSILWSFIGVLAALVFIAPQAGEGASFNMKALFTVFIATMVGAGIAEIAHYMMSASAMLSDKFANQAHLGIALICGAGAKPLLVAGIDRMTRVLGGGNGNA